MSVLCSLHVLFDIKILIWQKVQISITLLFLYPATWSGKILCDTLRKIVSVRLSVCPSKMVSQMKLWEGINEFFFNLVVPQKRLSSIFSKIQNVVINLGHLEQFVFPLIHFFVVRDLNVPLMPYFSFGYFAGNQYQIKN